MKVDAGFSLCPYSGKSFVIAMLAGLTLLSTDADAGVSSSFASTNQNYAQVLLPTKKPQPVNPVNQHQPAQHPAPQAAPQTKQASPAPKPAGTADLHPTDTTKLKADVTALNSTLDKYIKVGNKADLDLTVVITGIDIVAILNTDLTNIDHDSAVVRDLLGIAKQVPELKDQASLLLSALEKAQPSVKQAQKTTSDANASLMPTRNRLNTVDKGLRTLVSTAGILEKTLAVYSTALVKAEQCAAGLQTGKVRDSIQDNISHQSNDVDPYIVKANDGLIEIINVVNAIDQTIQSNTKQVIEPIHKIEQEVDAVERKIHAAVNPLHELSALFKKEFSAEFPYLSPTWKDPVRIRHHNFSIEFKVILQGEHAIEKEIEKILSKDMYNAAKLFGLGKLVKGIQHEAMKELNSIKGKLSLNIKMEIPGVDTIKPDLDAFEREVANINTPNINAQPIDDLLKKIQGEIPKLNAQLNSCKK